MEERQRIYRNGTRDKKNLPGFELASESFVRLLDGFLDALLLDEGASQLDVVVGDDGNGDVDRLLLLRRHVASEGHNQVLQVVLDGLGETRRRK